MRFKLIEFFLLAFSQYLEEPLCISSIFLEAFLAFSKSAEKFENRREKFRVKNRLLRKHQKVNNL